MAKESFKDKLIEAAKANQAQEQKSKIQLSKRASCIFLLSFLVLFLVVVNFIGKSFFMENKGFDIDKLSYASQAQVDMVRSVMIGDYSIDAEKSLICRAKGGLQEDYGECYLFGARLIGSEDNRIVLYCLLIGPPEAPIGIRTDGYDKSPYLDCETAKPTEYRGNYHYSKRYMTVDTKHLVRYYWNNFDIPEERTRGLLWSLFGLGKKAEIPVSGEG